MLNWFVIQLMIKSNKNDLKILAKARAHLQTMAKTAVKFQKIRQKTVKKSC